MLINSTSTKQAAFQSNPYSQCVKVSHFISETIMNIENNNGSLILENFIFADLC
jgi:hypothetical protein